MAHDSVLNLRRHLRTPKSLALLATTIQPCDDPAAKNLPFLFAKDRRHLDHGSAHRSGAVDGLLIAVEGDTGSIQFGEGIGHVKNAPAEPVDRPDHQHIKAATNGVLEHLVECGTLISSLGATDALVFVGPHNRPTPM